MWCLDTSISIPALTLRRFWCVCRVRSARLRSPQVGSPFRVPLIKFLSRYAQQTVELFLSEAKIKDAAWSRCFHVSRRENLKGYFECFFTWVSGHFDDWKCKQASTFWSWFTERCFLSTEHAGEGRGKAIPYGPPGKPPPPHQSRLRTDTGTGVKTKKISVADIEIYQSFIIPHPCCLPIVASST